LGDEIKDGLIRAIFEIHVDLDYTNDCGTYIMLKSEVSSEEEWLFGPGA